MSDDLVPHGQLDLDRERRLIDVRFGGIRVTAVGVREFDVRTTPQEATEAAVFASRFIDCGKWVIGDILVFAEGRRNPENTDPEREWSFEQIAAETGRSEQGVENIMSVCRRVPYDVRRPWLPWSIHEAIAKLPRAEQIAMLDRVEREGLTRDDVRELLRNPEPVTRRVTPPPSVVEAPAGSTSPPPVAPLANETPAESPPVVQVDRPRELRDVAKTIANSLPARGEDCACVPRDLIDRLRAALGEHE